MHQGCPRKGARAPHARVAGVIRRPKRGLFRTSGAGDGCAWPMGLADESWTERTHPEGHTPHGRIDLDAMRAHVPAGLVVRDIPTAAERITLRAAPPSPPDPRPARRYPDVYYLHRSDCRPGPSLACFPKG